MNTKYTKIIDDKTVIKDAKNIILYITQQIENPDTHEMEDMEFQVFNPTHEMLINDGWTVYVKPEPTEQEILNRTKREKINEINHYDSSDEVNIFYIQGLPVWLDKATRAGLKLRFEAELAMKEENTTLWYGNQSFTLQLNMAIQMLYAIEVYASKCYDNTQKHLANVEKLETLEEIIEYDYHTGYPEKLNF